MPNASFFANRVGWRSRASGRCIVGAVAAAGARRRSLTLALAVAAVTLSSVLGAQDALPNRPGSLKFLAFGDNGTGERPEYEVAQQMTSLRGRFAFDLVIMLGDNMYGSQRPADYVKKFEQPYAALLSAGVKFQASLGNHDRPDQVNYKPYNMNGQRFYTYVRGNVRFFALDSTLMDKRQLDWLEAALREARDDWKICYFHHPLYSNAARHGSSVDLRTLLEPLFVKYGVNVVFSGHDHVYERIKPQKGIYYWVVGSAGQLRAGNMNPTEETAASFDKDRAFLAVEIFRNDLFFQAISRTGQTVDSGTIRRQGVNRE
jgi:hypothetical protein